MLLRTLGGLELQGAELRRPKPLLLLAYLALEGPQERGHLAELFFGPGPKARANLSTTLSRLRRWAPGSVEADDVRVWTEIATDVAEFRTAVGEGDLERAITLYPGRFLAGFEPNGIGVELEEWIYRSREALAGEARGVLLQLAEQAAVPGQLEEAAAYAVRGYLLANAPEPNADELTRIYTLLAAAEHPQAAEVRAEAETFGVALTPSPQARSRLLAGRPETIPASPYKGLAYFQEQDEELFFGRDQAIAELIARVERQPLVAVIGSSGSGKSSLVFAGLIPRLRRAGDWVIATLRPGLRPHQALANSVLELLDDTTSTVERLHQAKKLAALLAADELSLADLLERVHQRHPEARLLLVLDQFEELYTISDFGRESAAVDGGEGQEGAASPGPTHLNCVGSVGWVVGSAYG